MVEGILMTEIQDTIHVHVEYFNGQGEADVGYPYYVASCQEIVAVTDARTWNELMRNIREMIAASLDEELTLRSCPFVPSPTPPRFARRGENAGFAPPLYAVERGLGGEDNGQLRKVSEEDTVALYNLVPNPRILVTMELPENYVEIA
jgi:hypothetical protein